jgi:hypothetical protein
LAKSTNYEAPWLYSFLHPPVTPSLFGPNILLSILFSNILSLCSSLTVRDHVSHPYEEEAKNAKFSKFPRILVIPMPYNSVN